MRPIPRRALIGATLGAVYALLILPAPQTLLGVFLPGVAWFILAASLLFLHPISYHAYVFWGILWITYRAITLGREGQWLALVLDLPLPAASLYFVMTSGYREVASEARGADGAASASDEGF